MYVYVYHDTGLLVLLNTSAPYASIKCKYNPNISNYV